MTKSEELLSLFLQYANHDAELTRRNTKKSLQFYDNSELNCVHSIGNLEMPNVTAIAADMHMTRGAISKILKKLAEKGVVNSYQLPDNRQKIFFRLTEKGQELYGQHAERHQKWSDLELRFFEAVPQKEAEIVISFMRRFNEHLQSCLEDGKEE